MMDIKYRGVIMTKKSLFISVLFVLIVGFAFTGLVGCDNGSTSSGGEDVWNPLRPYDTGKTIFGIPYSSMYTYAPYVGGEYTEYYYRVELPISDIISQMNTFSEFVGYPVNYSFAVAEEVQKYPNGFYLKINSGYASYGIAIDLIELKGETTCYCYNSWNGVAIH